MMQNHKKEGQDSREFYDVWQTFFQATTHLKQFTKYLNESLETSGPILYLVFFSLS